MATSTGASYTLGNVIQELVGKNIRLFPIMFKQFKHIAYAFFDVMQLAGKGGLSLKMKNIPGIEPSLTVDGYSVKWLDYGVFDFNTTIKGNQSLTLSSFSTSIDVTDTSGFAVNDTVYGIKGSGASAASQEFDGIITAITDSDTIVVKVSTIDGVAATTSQSLALVAGVVVERGSWKRNDNDEVTRPSALYNYSEYQSFVQHFSRRMEFTKAELNKEYKYEGEAKMEAQMRFEYNLGILMQELNKMLYKGKNIAPGTGANDKMEMLGLETVCREAGSIVDLASSTNPVKDLFQQFEYAFQSGAVMGSEPVILLVNDAFLTNLARSNADKVRYQSYVEELKFEVMKLTTVFGAVEILRDPMLNRLYSYPVAFTLPRSLVKLWVRENQEFNPKGGITRSDQSVRLYDVIENIRERKRYDLEFEMGMVAGGMSSNPCPYRMIKNFIV